MKRRIVIVIGLLLTLLTAGLGWLGGSESGLQWAYRQVLPQLPGELEVDRIDGRLIGPILLHELRYRDASGVYAADDLEFDWNPWALFGARLDIDRLELGGLRIMPAAAAPASQEALQIPAIRLPLAISLRRLVIENALIVRAGQTTEIRRLESALQLNRDGLQFDRLTLESVPGQLELSGRLKIDPQLEHDLHFEWQARPDSTASWQGRGRLAGNLQQTRLQHRFDGVLQADLSLELDAPLGQLRWRGELDVDDFDASRVDPELPVLQGSLQLEAEGDLRSASTRGQLDLRQSPHGPLQTRFRLERASLRQDAQGLTFAGLELDLFEGRVTADGSFDWEPQLRWQAQVAAAAVNPATLYAEWPGRIDAELAIEGELETAGPVIALDIKRLHGQLRDYPLELRGAANWRADRAILSGIELTSGNSRISVDGNLAQTLDLQWSLRSDDLAELYPGARGRVDAAGRLAGPLEQANIEARLRGAALEYDDYSATALAAKIALELDLERAAEFEFAQIDVELEASELKLQQQRLRRVALRTDGRRTRAEIEADAGFARIELIGELAANRWRGQLVEALLQNPEYGSWRLPAPADLSAAPGELDLTGACLESAQNGRLCADFKHRDTAGSIRFDLLGAPLALLQRWLPGGISASGTANASGNLSYDPRGQLRGEVELDLPPGRVSYELAPGEPQALGFERVRMQTRLSASGIEARIDAALEQGDAIAGTIFLPGASLPDFDYHSQALEADFELRLSQLGPIDAALPQIERLRGVAEIEVEIGGQIGQPRLNGSARLRNAALYLPELDLELERIQIDASSTDLQQVDYRLQAGIAGGELLAEGRTELDAAAGWPSRLSLSGKQMIITRLLQQRLPENLELDGRLDLDGSVEFSLTGQATAKAVLRLPSATLAYPLRDGELERWRYRDIELDLRLENRTLSLHSGFSIGANQLRAELRLAQFDPFALAPETQALDGKIEIDLRDLSLTEALLPDVQRTSGSLQTSLAIGGTLTRPTIRGRSQVRDAELQIARLGLNLEKINLTAETDAAGLTQFSGSLHSGEGAVELAGSIRLDPGSGWPGTISIRGENFEVARIPEARINLSPQLEISIADKIIDIEGEVLVPYAKLQPRDISTAARVSGDTVIVGEEKEANDRWQIRSRVRLILGERVTFFGYGFDGRLGGNLLIEESPGKPTRGSGEITILEGRYRAYGQHLDVEQGRLLFSGSALTNPGLDIRAVRETGDVVAGIRVSGRLQNPRLDLFSNPAMGETDTLSYLLTGGPLDSASSGQGAMMAKAAIALGLSGGDRIARSLSDQFGLDEMRIESSSSGDQASLVVGRYLSPRLYVGYGVGLIESINTLNLRYRIADNWQLEAESGAHQGADLFYSFER